MKELMRLGMAGPLVRWFGSGGKVPRIRSAPVIARQLYGTFGFFKRQTEFCTGFKSLR